MVKSSRGLAVVIVSTGFFFAACSRQSYEDCVLKHTQSQSTSTGVETIKASCKAKYPKTFDFEAIALEQKYKTWPEILALEDAKVMSDVAIEEMSNAYFDDVILKHVHPDFTTEAREQFEAYTYRLNRGRERKSPTAPEF